MSKSVIKVIDVHTHLEGIEDVKGAMRRAEEVGVVSVITVGSDHESNKIALEISGRYGATTVYPALGIHPWYLGDIQESSFRFIEENIKQAVAIGEIGLDYWLKGAKKDSALRDRQKQVFKRLLALSERYGTPAIIHARGAWEDCLHLAVKAGIRKAVFHWFSGPLEVLDRILNNGYYISATPAAEYSKQHQAAISKTPIEKLLLETDSPVAYQGVKSEPAHVLRTLAAVAKITGIEKPELANITTRNAITLFNLE